MVTSVLIHWHSDQDLTSGNVSHMKSLSFLFTFSLSLPRTLSEVLYAISSKHSLVIMVMVIPI